jgi:hypothetical protein
MVGKGEICLTRQVVYVVGGDFAGDKEMAGECMHAVGVRIFFPPFSPEVLAKSSSRHFRHIFFPPNLPSPSTVTLVFGVV